jgi:hypothetical protein
MFVFVLFGFSCLFPQVPIKIIPFEPGQLLSLKIKSPCDLTIKGHSEKTIKYKVSGDLKDQPEIIQLFQDSPGVYAILIRENIKYLKKLELYIPQNTKLLIDQFHGDVEVNSLADTLEIKAKSANISLKSLQAETQTIKIFTSKGNIVLSDSQINSFLSTNNGYIKVKNVEGNPIIKSSGGDIVFRNVYPGNQLIHIRNTGGSVNISSAPAGADIINAGGDIRIGNAREFVVAKAVGGNITVLSLKGSIEARTTGGDINVTIKDSPKYPKKDIKLTSLSGEITLIIPEFFSMNYQARIINPSRSSSKYRIFNDFQNSKNPNSNRIKNVAGICLGGKHKVRISTSFGNIYFKKH